MSDSGKELVRRVYDAITRRDLDALAAPIADVFRIADGRIAEHWGVTDTGALVQQLGQA